MCFFTYQDSTTAINSEKLTKSLENYFLLFHSDRTLAFLGLAIYWIGNRQTDNQTIITLCLHSKHYQRKLCFVFRGQELLRVFLGRKTSCYS